ncbi:hypothetical protein THRCLA_20642 [Thraustotheca clavata]|uniref:DH domain-containing protein n=1 Tax=Thraustotheca clavata TaxID=74557 RepID=A0A1W0A549_9STRA|nr:hypothetical protein THRCLA_20642 [Thraustotheca clavata]
MNEALGDWKTDLLRIPAFFRVKRMECERSLDDNELFGKTPTNRRLSQLHLLSGHHIRLDSFRRQHPAFQDERSVHKEEIDDEKEGLLPVDIWDEIATSHPSMQCYAVLQEIIDTEKSYLGALTAMKSVFDKVFTRAFTHPALTTLHATTLSLHQLHTELVSALPELRKVEADLVPQSHQLIAILHYRLPFFKLYSHYCTSYKDVTQLLHVRPVTSVAPECQTFMVELCHASRQLNVDIQSEMIKPVQRLCRYPLLISEWLTFAPKELATPLHELLNKAKDIAALVNERVRAEQNNLKLFDLRTRLVGPSCPELCIPTRHFVDDIPLHVVSMMSLVPWEMWMSRPRTLIVLSDLLLITKPTRRHRLKICKQYTWTQVLIEEIDIVKHPSWDTKRSFILRCVRYDGQWNTMVLKCDNAKHKCYVMSLLRTAGGKQFHPPTAISSTRFSCVSAV